MSYIPTPQRVAENESLAAAVFDALRQARPAGLRHATPGKCRPWLARAARRYCARKNRIISADASGPCTSV